LQIVPKYLFTKDGTEPYDNYEVGPLTTRIKSMEKNQHVLNHVLFWADVLAGGKSEIEMGIGRRSAIIVAEKTPLAAIANFAIPYDPATYEESPEDIEVQLGLFGLQGVVDEEDDEY
jgi:hypothetical protein